MIQFQIDLRYTILTGITGNILKENLDRDNSLCFTFSICRAIYCESFHCYQKAWSLFFQKSMMFIYKLDRSLMIGWRKNYWNPERMSTLHCLSFCVSVGVSARFVFFSKFSLLLFYCIFIFFHYITLVSFVFKLLVSFHLGMWYLGWVDINLPIESWDFWQFSKKKYVYGQSCHFSDFLAP